MFTKVDTRQSLPAMEEEILKYWNEHSIFEKSVKNRESAPVYSFYDGPPFATGLPHYGHIVGQTLKDAVPRYWTMRGFQVERKWGWDCHGLPIENIAEKALGVNRKKDIEAMGVEKFNEFCRSKVLEYTEDWKTVTMRLGRWADRDHAYRTMDKDYMESVWWVFKQLWDKGLVYEHYRSMHVCTRCETTLSQSEVSEGYADVKDLSVVAKFAVKAGQAVGMGDAAFVIGENTFILAWTTTPWTLPGNAALAVGEDIEYVVIDLKRDWTTESESEETNADGLVSGENVQNDVYILGKKLLLENKLFEGLLKDACAISGIRIDDVISGKIDVAELTNIQVVQGKDLVGLQYTPPFDIYSHNTTLENYAQGWKVYGAAFVTTEDGTGVVHIAPAFGEDDMQLGKDKNLPFIQHLGMDGIIKDEVTALAGMAVKSKENPSGTDVEVIKYLAAKKLLFAKQKYEHSYPHCWRCDTPLINYATSSWFARVTEIKDQALDNAQSITWSPEHVKAGRFGKWLEGARDWSISRQRFWASVIPVWKCNECNALRVFGSARELEDASGQKVDDLHKHIVDTVVMPCTSCVGTMKRIPDVLDTWFDSGSMPFAQHHYPFENKEAFEKNFPADFIAEGIDQTRAWFYYLHILATAVTSKPSFKNVIVNGIVLAEDGKKMSKRLNNYPDPMLMFEKYGADAMRLYLLSSPIVTAENLNFSEKDMAEVSRNIFRMLWNSYSFFVMYAEIDGWNPNEQGAQKTQKASENILDRWIISELQLLIKEMNAYMENYDIMRATRLIGPFIDDLSNWFIRQSRKRFWKSDDDTDKAYAYQTLHTVLVTLAKIMAPFTPFIAEEVYRNLTGEESIHLSTFPEYDANLVDDSLLKHMQTVREIITNGLQKRAELKIKVRQPLAEISLGDAYADVFHEILNGQSASTDSQFLQIVRDELNVESVTLNVLQLQQNSNDHIILDTNITSELLMKGQAREIIRTIQEARKKAGYDVDDRIEVVYAGFEIVFGDDVLRSLIQKETLAENGLHAGEIIDADLAVEVSIDGQTLKVWLKK